MRQSGSEAKCRVLLGKLQGKRPPGEIRFRWEDVIRGNHQLYPTQGGYINFSAWFMETGRYWNEK
jgi:hypothetical protein